MTQQEFSDRLGTILASQGPTSKARAAEIAGMTTFGFLEFFELTGIDRGDYGIYNIDDVGIRLRMPVDDPSLTGQQRIALRIAADRLRGLDFPCDTEDFCNWYETTRGENQVSDFPLAVGFLDALGKKPPSIPTSNATAVPSTKIMAAFAVKPETEQNNRWWSDRMRGCKRYGFAGARASQGGRGRGKPSYWHPLAIAAWLIEGQHLTKGEVVHAVTTHFPDCDVDYL